MSVCLGRYHYNKKDKTKFQGKKTNKSIKANGKKREHDRDKARTRL
jgi:hypothetical protein